MSSEKGYISFIQHVVSVHILIYSLAQISAFLMHAQTIQYLIDNYLGLFFEVIEGNTEESVTKASGKIASVLEQVGWWLSNQIPIYISLLMKY